MELLTPTVSLVVGEPEQESEKEDPVEPEPVPDVESEKEKTPVASGSRCKRSTAKGFSQECILKLRSCTFVKEDGTLENRGLF